MEKLRILVESYTIPAVVATSEDVVEEDEAKRVLGGRRNENGIRLRSNNWEGIGEEYSRGDRGVRNGFTQLWADTISEHQRKSLMMLSPTLILIMLVVISFLP